MKSGQKPRLINIKEWVLLTFAAILLATASDHAMQEQIPVEAKLEPSTIPSHNIEEPQEPDINTTTANDAIEPVIVVSTAPDQGT